MMNRPLFVMTLALAVSACSDGGGSSEEPVVDLNANPAGIWRGKMTTMLEKEHLEKDPSSNVTEAGQHDILIIADDQGYMRIISSMGVFEGSAETEVQKEEDFLARGKIQKIDVNDATGYWDIYSMDPKSLKPQESSTQIRLGNLSGDLFTRESWSGDISIDDLTLFTFDVSYDEEESLKGATAQTLAALGTLTDLTGNGAVPLSLTFAADGTLNGSAGDCHYSGTYFVPDSTYNIYQFVLAIDNAGSCAPLKGNYGGMGALITENNVQTLKVSVGNAERILSYDLTQ